MKKVSLLIFAAILATLTSCEFGFGGSNSQGTQNSTSAPISASVSDSQGNSNSQNSEISQSVSNSSVQDTNSNSVSVNSQTPASVSKPSESISTSVTPEPSKYKLKWEDNFDGGSLNEQYWNYMYGDGSDYGISWGWGNGELQSYEKENVSLRDGNLVITARRQSSRGKEYTSARITTKDKISTTYGRVEARMTLPVGQGLWPAFWMLPDSNTPYGGWPHSGEIDIMEARGRLKGETTGALHYSDLNGAHQYQSGVNYFSGTDLTAWHVYAVEWDKNQIKWFVDDNNFMTITADRWSTQANPSSLTAPFDSDFHILFNFAIGGQFDGFVAPDASFQSAEMKVDYVRIYEMNGSDTGEEEKKFISFGGEGDIVNKPNQFIYWNDQNWNGSIVSVGDTADERPQIIGDEAVFKWKVDSGSCDWGFQVFYKNSNLTNNQRYRLQGNLYSSKAGSVKINDQVINIVAGNNNIDIMYVEGTVGNEKISSFVLICATSFAGSDQVTLKISNLNWTAC